MHVQLARATQIMSRSHALARWPTAILLGGGGPRCSMCLWFTLGAQGATP